MIESWNRRREELLFRHRAAQATLEAEEKALAEALKREATVAEARDILQATGQALQQQAHERIADVVTRCLAAVFPDPFEFKIVFERKRGRTEARMVFVKDGQEVDPLLGAGGGAVDVAAFALRVACLMMTKPPLRKLLVLDEPMKNVHGERQRERARELVETISRELGIQIVVCTGLEWLQCGKVVEL